MLVRSCHYCGWWCNLNTMEAYRHGAVYAIRYHFVWIPKRRKPILVGAVAQRLREIFNSVGEDNGWTISCGVVNAISLSDRSYVCEGCGQTIDRDWDAARNIQRQGLIDLGIVAVGHTETQNTRGETIRLATASASR